MQIIHNDKKKSRDNYLTPPYAVKPLLKYIKEGSTIWCPFDKDNSAYVQIFKANGFKVVNTHIDVRGGGFL